MGLLEIFCIGIGLSMDAAAVSMTNGMVYAKLSKFKFLMTALAFGFFQALMPALGYFTGTLFAGIMEKYSGIVIFVILGSIGGKMMKDGFSGCGTENCEKKEFTYNVLILQAIATSIDAFAVGVSFVAAGLFVSSLLPALLLIGITTFVISLLSLALGRKFGDKLGSKAEIIGALILILIGIKALF